MMSMNPKRNLSAAHLRAIGLVAVTATDLEWSVEQAIADLCRFPDHVFPEALLTHIPMNVRLDMLLSVASEFFEDQSDLQELRKITIQIREAVNERNRTIHSFYVDERSVPRRVTRWTMRARGRVKHDLRYMTVRDIEGVARALDQARRKLSKFFATPRSSVYDRE